MGKHAGKRGDFWSKVDKSGGRDACWPWIGSKNTDGYGQVRINKKLHRSHRVAWEKTYGPIPEGLNVGHICDNRPCCNPKHLFVAEQTVNAKDMWNKGRANVDGNTKMVEGHDLSRGEKNAHAKITKDDAREIRRLWRTGRYTKKQLAERYPISDVMIGKIVRNEAWN